MNSKESEFTLEPVSIYQTFKLEPGQQTQKFTFGINNTDIDSKEILSSLGESAITRNLIAKTSQCENLLQSLGIHYPNCWIGIEFKKELLLPDWPHTKPGDIDIIAGNFIEDSHILDLNSTIAIQIKIRKIRNYDDLKSFPSGNGTFQTQKTSQMGFPRTYLGHIIIREPREIGDNQSISWNAMNNASFGTAFKRCYGLIKKELETCPYGYIALGWGQAHGMDWRVSGAFSMNIAKEAPIINQLNDHKMPLFNSLRSIFEQPRNDKRPLIADGQKYR